jgi:hypothetical protein
MKTSQMKTGKDILDQPQNFKKGKVKKSGWNKIVLLILALMLIFVIYSIL